MRHFESCALDYFHAIAVVMMIIMIIITIMIMIMIMIIQMSRVDDVV